jgi:uncharacterized protein (DUF697 family)
VALPVSFGVLRGLAKEIQVSSHDARPLVVGGARELAAVLRRELGKDAKPGGIRQSDDPRGGAVFVYVLTHDPSEDDEQALKRARRARVPIVAVAVGPGPKAPKSDRGPKAPRSDRGPKAPKSDTGPKAPRSDRGPKAPRSDIRGQVRHDDSSPHLSPVSEDITIPFVHATDIVWVGAGEGFPLDAIAQVIAARLAEDGAPLAARVPVLRGAVCDVLIASASRRNGIVGAAIFIPGADLPVLLLAQVRMVLRLEQAYGLDADPRQRAPEVLATIAAGFGFRAVARQLLGVIPVAGWAVQGLVAYSGTRALGEATIKRLEVPIHRSAAPGGDESGPATRPRAGASHGAP